MVSAQEGEGRKVSRALEGKLALITGASRGIGAAISQNLASKGANLILNYTSESSAQKTKDLSKSLEGEHGVQCLIIQADMGSPEGPVSIITKAKEQYGDAFKLDILINNAGVSRNLSIANCTIEDFNWQYQINVLGPLLLMQACLPYLPHDRSGRIVNISSVSSSEGFPLQSVYGGTKAALEAMTRTWARELSERATVNAVNPGPVKTDMWGGTSEEFQGYLRPFIQKTPGSKIRKDIDDKDLVDDEERAGGRPAASFCCVGIFEIQDIKAIKSDFKSCSKFGSIIVLCRRF
ncbi:putative Versicolorin reductase [Glarea lozoyensis 74030]|uniref:Putative Versicolorin reductase n=1 Tax=Glarea lozoyensis (strain ATCC 74030 / MF5533) TaxID=1104152 RepID=H0ENZ6_GLAL7|nr:putative Versicolorin reductase [Glarea lozoyensis 74030]